MPRLLRGVARTAVIAGTASAVSGRVQRRQAEKYASRDANIYAQQDHLVPPDASRALRDLAGTDDYTELAFKGGHIGIYVSGRAQHEVPQTIHDWLAKRAR